ncbi:uncharacterized protein LOC135679814 isoform X2 [Musa acuminata AAA Group]|uniref:uncharacterized protein LOC135679814 isoform X2 n=1 Tax=Musa acuminata AAA Group TaxID=214697 RepID=UPI0031DFE146
MKELMEISCDLDLRLRLSSSGSDVCPTDSGTVGSNGLVEFLGKSKESQQQQITLFYNGRICVCNLTDTKVCNDLISFLLCKSHHLHGQETDG